MTWTAHENALYIRSAVQRVQNFLGFRVHDGKYTRELHEAYRAALEDAGLPTQYLDDGGPEYGVALLADELSSSDIRAFQVAWAWWARLRGKPPYPRQMLYRINDWNEYESDGGPLTIRDTKLLDLFVGDGREVKTGTRTLWYAVVGLLGAVAVGYLGVRYGRSSCPVIQR